MKLLSLIRGEADSHRMETLAKGGWISLEYMRANLHDYHTSKWLAIHIRKMQ